MSTVERWTVPPSVANPLKAKMLVVVLSVIAGSVDAIGFLGLGGLFMAHVTGNLVILVAHLVASRSAPAAAILAIPVFVTALVLTRLLAGALESFGLASLRPLLLLQLLLLCGFFILCVFGSTDIDPDATNGILAGMLGVSAMAVQNALVQTSLKGTPATAVMTTNITRIMMDTVEMMLARGPADVAMARDRVMRTWPTIVGFAVGCGLGATSETAIGLRSLALPAGLALLAVAMGTSAAVPGSAS
jgi:uncharacterized membrane protein YoaK (UPF0700 family)